VGRGNEYQPKGGWGALPDSSDAVCLLYKYCVSVGLSGIIMLCTFLFFICPMH